jgi:hypothetical protein
MSKSNDIYHEETYTHKNGKSYHVCWYYDYDMGSPLENGDGYGVTERMDWNPTDEEQLEQHIVDFEPELEEETRLRLMRQLSRPSNRYDSGLYYDVLSSLHKAKTEWGVAPERCMETVEKDYAYLKGWYDDDWHWLTVGVAPLDEDGEPMEDDREYCGGYESTILNDDEDNRAYKREAIEDKIGEIEWAIKKALHKNQLELDLCPT